MLRDLRSSKCRSDSRGCIDAEDDHTVLERSDIGAHNIDDVQKTNMASPVKNVATDVGLNVRANSLDDHAKNTDQEHHAEALDTTPEIDDLRHGQWDTATKCCRDDGSNGEQAVRRES